MKKNSLPGIAGSQKKYIAAAVIAALFLLCVLSLLMRGRRANAGAKIVEEDTISYSLKWQGEEYEGTYTGSTAGSMPEGSGVFSDSNGGLTYSGEWKNGKFEGFGSIQYGDGTHEEGMYTEGRRHHWVRRYDTDTHYKDGIYDYNVLYGCQSEYQDGKLKHETLIANGDHVSQIKKKAVKLTRSLIEAKEYIDQYVYIKGEVVYLQETETSCYFRIQSDSVGMVTGNYTNTVGYRSKQPMVLNMELGDEVTVYGFYTGAVRDELEEDKDYYGYECMQIDPVFGELSSGDKDRGSYTSIQRNPFSYVGKSMVGDYVVEQCMKSSETFYVFAHPAGLEQERYVIRIEADPDLVLYGGETVNLKGFIVGQRKVEVWKTKIDSDDEQQLQITGYKKYPVIGAISYEFK